MHRSHEDPCRPAADQVSVEIQDPAACPRFAARWLDDVRNGASPPWMQQRLLAAGMRPISAVVDVTNYVMHELGQPMHAYDADTVPDGQIVVRRARAGETLETIDHEQRRARRADAGHRRSRASDRPGRDHGRRRHRGHRETRRVILESAIFHGPTIRNTARRLALRSEASMRHEKGIGHELPRYAADRAVRLMAEITGARVASGIVDNDPEPATPRVVEVELPRVERLLGIAVTRRGCGEPAAAVGLRGEWRRAAGGDGAGSPARRRRAGRTWRRRSPAPTATTASRAGCRRPPCRRIRPDPAEPRHRVRRILAGLGLDEVVLHALIGADDLDALRL